MGGNTHWGRSSDSSLKDSLRRRLDRRGTGDEDRVLAGHMSGVHISSSQAVGASVRVQSRAPVSGSGVRGPSDGAVPGTAKRPEEGSHIESRQQQDLRVSAPESLRGTAGSGTGLEATASAPLLYPTISHGPLHVSTSAASFPNQPGGSTSNPMPMQRAGLAGPDTVKVLCSYGGCFADCPASDFGKAYQGGTTRLISLQLAQQTCFSQLLLQLAASSLGINGNISEEDVRVHYELPGEQGIYVSITNDQDVANMYEEWDGTQNSGPPKKLRLFVETSGAGPASASLSESNSAAESHNWHGRASSADAVQLSEPNSDNADVAQSAPLTDAAGLAVDCHDESPELLMSGVPTPNNAVLELLRNRMELIPKEDVQVSKLLGAGGYGEVYLGKWRDATDVAVKCLSPSLIAADGDIANANPQHVADLLDEAQLLFNLRHPNVVWVYGLVLDPAADATDTSRFRTPAIVAEYMASGSLLAALSRREQSLKQGWVRVVVALDAARGMEYLHSKKIVHFDLKSANLLLAWRDRRPTCKVADFGLSKQRRQTYVSGVKPHTGTLPWMAPEILKTPNAVGEKADVYSFAVVMWELWTWLEPHTGLQYATLLHKRMTESAIRPELPGSPEWPESTPCPEQPCVGWQELMQSCWAEDPELRPGFQEIVSELKKMLDSVRPGKKPQPAD